MRCCEGTLQTTACLLILIIYDLPLIKNNNNYIWSQVILILFLFSLSHHLIFSFTCIVHPDIKLSRIPVQSLEQGLFKVPLSLKTKYIYIYLLQDEAILQLASFMAQLTYTGSPILCVVLTSISH